MVDVVVEVMVDVVVEVMVDMVVEVMVDAVAHTGDVSRYMSGSGTSGVGTVILMVTIIC